MCPFKLELLLKPLALGSYDKYLKKFTLHLQGLPKKPSEAIYSEGSFFASKVHSLSLSNANLSCVRTSSKSWIYGRAITQIPALPHRSSATAAQGGPRRSASHFKGAKAAWASCQSRQPTRCPHLCSCAGPTEEISTHGAGGKQSSPAANLPRPPCTRPIPALPRVLVIPASFRPCPVIKITISCA